jgi:hypothetical protein
VVFKAIFTYFLRLQGGTERKSHPIGWLFAIGVVYQTRSGVVNRMKANHNSIGGEILLIKTRIEMRVGLECLFSAQKYTARI